MTYVRRVQEVLASRSGEKLFGHQIAALAGLAPKSFQKHAAVLIKNGHVCRAKFKDGRASFYQYWLSEEQLRLYRRHVERFSDDFNMVTGTDEIPDRLSFLRMLREKTVFAEHATLGLIISDYERTLNLRRKLAQRAMEDEG